MLFSCGHRWEALDRLAVRAVIKWDVRLEKGNNCSWTFMLLMLFILVVKSEQDTHKACQVHLMFRNVPDNDVCIFLQMSLYNCWIWQEDCSRASICKLWDNIWYIHIISYYIILSFGNQDLNMSKHVQTHFLFNPLFSKWDATVTPLPPPGGCCVQSWKRNSPGRGASEGTAGWSWSKSSRCRRCRRPGDVCIYHHIPFLEIPRIS